MKTCAISGKSLSDFEAVSCASVGPLLFKHIQASHPDMKETDCISRDALSDLKADYVERALSDEIGELTTLEREVIESIREHEILASKPDDAAFFSQRTFGEKLSDRIASFGGSWKFIIAFGAFIVLWIAANILLWRSQDAPDPYPFILLNLMLSCLAALQAPIIMMSQNRQESRDRARAEKDYQVNLKAELEIRHLHEKLDHLLHHHSERLLEIQQVQMDLLKQLVDRGK